MQQPASKLFKFQNLPLEVNEIQKILDKGHNLDIDMYYLAIKKDDLDLVKWLRKNGCPWVSSVCAYSITENRYEIFRWIMKNAFAWSGRMMDWAAETGNITALQWLREARCPWTKWASARAAAKGHLDTLIWMIENGCPYEKGLICEWARQHGHTHVIAWASKNIA